MHNFLILFHGVFSAAEILSNRIVLEIFRSDEALSHLPDVMAGENKGSPQSIWKILGSKIKPKNAMIKQRTCHTRFLITHSYRTIDWVTHSCVFREELSSLPRQNHWDSWLTYPLDLTPDFLPTFHSTNCNVVLIPLFSLMCSAHIGSLKFWQ